MPVRKAAGGLTEPLLYDPLVPIAEPLVKWAVEVHRLDDLPMIVRRAAKVATTAPTVRQRYRSSALRSVVNPSKKKPNENK